MFYFQFTLSLVILLSIPVLAISMLTLRLTLDRRVRSALPADKIYDNFPDWYLGFGRAIAFGVASIFEYPKRSPIMIDFYDSFDVKGFAHCYEKTVAWIMVISLGTQVFTGILYCALQLLDMWPPMEWPE